MADLELGNVFNVKGLVAVVTGGGTGIGLMMAQALEANGATVYVLGRRQEILDQAAATAKHNNIFPLVTDVTSKESLAAAASKVAEKSGYVNLLVANSGAHAGKTLDAMPQNPTVADFQSFMNSYEVEDFTKVFATNTAGVFFTAGAFLTLLDEGNKKGNVAQRSQVLVTASAGAFERKPFGGHAYSCGKAATIHLAKQFATVLAPFGIRTNALAPGLFHSEMTNPFYEATFGGKEALFPKDFVPLERGGNRMDMAGVVLFMASPAGAYLTGSILLHDGGVLSLAQSTY